MRAWAWAGMGLGMGMGMPLSRFVCFLGMSMGKHTRTGGGPSSLCRRLEIDFGVLSRPLCVPVRACLPVLSPPGVGPYPRISCVPGEVCLRYVVAFFLTIVHAERTLAVFVHYQPLRNSRSWA